MNLWYKIPDVLYMKLFVVFSCVGDEKRNENVIRIPIILNLVRRKEGYFYK